MLTAPTAPSPPTGTRRRTASLRAALPALAAYAAARALGVLLVAAWGARRGTPGLHRLAAMWDAYWYQGIVVHGYAGFPPVPGPHGPYEAYAFFPAYPALIRLVHLCGVPVGAAALAVAWLASLAAAWGIFRVGEHLYGRRVGVIAAVLWGVTPYALVESAAYSEPLFTAFVAWALYAAVRRDWLGAGVLALLAGLSRPTGIALAAAVSGAALWELLRGRAGWRAAAGMLLAPLGFLGYLGWVGLVKGRWDGYFRVQDAWQSHFDFGRKTFYSLRDLLVRPDAIMLADVVVAVVLAASVLLFALSIVQRQPLVLVLFSGAMLLLALGDAAYFNSRARFLLPAFTLLLPVATGLARVRSRASLVLILCSAALASALYGGYLAFVYPDAP
ncbi:hypothetical protein CFP65_2884 [Kitasatospora sp. MMS16-BH015]|uniref:glycosyltransferase family 39 protein n=1 Tax=Kitasatospora sp. MMS16-BH015 TaxID=2018025 RepID=UPI000CA3D2F5|nr:glycosyltransferase family 39 protein [Kitasatospora sp. MMS16-BH015]AUG77697.1 hypothetical protein CFP65_2884 [Kitasatospora sp. MMS16-BH015]